MNLRSRLYLIWWVTYPYRVVLAILALTTFPLAVLSEDWEWVDGVFKWVGNRMDELDGWCGL